MLMMSCQKTTQLLSESMERDISRIQRFTLRLHLLGCRSCSRFREQLFLLREAGLSLRVRLRRDQDALLNTLRPELRDSLQQIPRQPIQTGSNL